MGSMMDFAKTQEWTTGPLTLDERIKLLAVIEHPDTADGVRKALRFYQAPETAVPDLRKLECPYTKQELAPVLNLVKGAKAILVVGAGFGGVLKQLVAVMPKGSLAVAVERPQEELNLTASLKETCRQLMTLGANVELFLGDSRSKKLRDAIEAYAPFDFIFVSGSDDDEENYSHMGRIIGRAGATIEIIYRE